MLKPIPVAPQVARPAGAAPTDLYLYLDGRTIASPAFRILLWCDGNWRAAPNRGPLLAIFDQFVAGWGASIRSVTRTAEGGRHRTLPAGPETLTDMRQKIEAGDPTLDQGLRLAGWLDEPHFIEAAPCLRIGTVGALAYLSVEVPHQSVHLVQMADRVTELAGAMALRCGLAGFGFFLPDYLEPLGFAFPMGIFGTVAAIEITPVAAAHALNAEVPIGRDVGAFLPDIGWRTLIGAPLHDILAGRMIEGLLGHDAVQLSRHGGLIAVTAGANPIWGRVVEGEDLTPYRRAAEMLRTLRIPGRIAEHHLFGPDGDNPERSDRVRAYLQRYDG